VADQPEFDREIRNEVVWVPELAHEGNIVRRIFFEDCLLMGPAVVAFLGHVNIHASSFAEQIEEVLWEYEPMRPYKWTGAIGMEDCTFNRCQFHRIGILANPDAQMSIRAALSNLD
jgi:hypothetical protein